MKKLTSALVLLGALSMVGCSTDDDIISTDPVVEVRNDPKLYTTTIGTYIDIKNDDYDYSDSRGSLILKKSDGSTMLAADLTGSIYGEVTYEIKNINGNVYTRRELISSAFRTDVNGDFNATLLYDTQAGEAVQAIKSVDATLVVISNDIAYEKKLSVSTESIWDMAMGIGTILFEYDIVKHHSKFRDYDNELQQSFDINADVELNQAANQNKSKQMVARSKVTIRDK